MSQFHVENIVMELEKLLNLANEHSLLKLKDTVNTILIDWSNLTSENERLKEEIKALKEGIQ